MTTHPNETPEPLAQEQAGEMAIRKALEEFPKGWQTVFQEVRERERGVVEIGALWEDSEDLAEVITIDTGNYYDNASAMPMARFIAACNHIAVAAILAALQAKDAEIARLKADAGRYRWLRTYPNNLNAAVYGPTRAGPNTGGLLCRDDYLDSAIDAMKGEAP
jgi:hypothetical protein